MSDDKRRRTLPTSELDMQMLVTDPEWGQPTISKDLRDKLNLTISEDQDEVTFENLWELLGYYKRDMRLGNLSNWNGEFQYCHYYLDLAGDLLQAGYVQSFIICLSRVATVLELSQSKKGFLRKLFNTHRQEYNENVADPDAKKGFFGNKKTKED